MKSRVIYTKIWRDSFFLDLTINEKLLFIYYLTNEFVNILHFYECPDVLASRDTQIPIKEVEAARKKFNEANRILSYKSYIYLKNADKYEQFTGESNETAKHNLMAELSEEIRDWYNKIKYTPPYTRLHTHQTGARNKNTEINNKSKSIYKQRGEPF